jgi:hypothetical protein
MGSWTKPQQWETHRKWFRSALASVRPPAKVTGVWRPAVSADVRTLIRTMAQANTRLRLRLWLGGVRLLVRAVDAERAAKALGQPK